jgi:hypothetical protein
MYMQRDGGRRCIQGMEAGDLCKGMEVGGGSRDWSQKVDALGWRQDL